MKQYCFRLRRGQDLLLSLQNFVTEHAIDAAIVGSAVGCVSAARVRDSSGVTVRSLVCPLEIVSLTGTLGRRRTHLHIAFSKEDLSTVGGHLLEGCIINTTCEMVLLALDDVVFGCESDPETGYDEIVFETK